MALLELERIIRGQWIFTDHKGIHNLWSVFYYESYAKAECCNEAQKRKTPWSWVSAERHALQVKESIMLNVCNLVQRESL